MHWEDTVMPHTAADRDDLHVHVVIFSEDESWEGEAFLSVTADRVTVRSSVPMHCLTFSTV